MKLHLPRRPAFTLVELMVVVGLIVVLATLVVGVANSSLVDSYKVVGAADRVSGWLLQAKARALRDRVPVGLRLIRDGENPNFVRQAQLVELPALYAPNQDSNPNTIINGAPLLVVRYSSIPAGQPNAGDLIQENSASEAGVYLYWPSAALNLPFPTLTVGLDLNIGDLLRLNELGSTHRITGITPGSAPAWFPPVPAGVVYKLTLAVSPVKLPVGESYPSTPPYPANVLPAGTAGLPPVGVAGPQLPPNQQPYPAVLPSGWFWYATGYPAIGGANYYQSRYFGLFRASRPILGEPLLQLPANMAIDLTPSVDVGATGPSAGDIPSLSVNVPLNSSLTAPEYEIVFNPNGTVLMTDAGFIGLWLRDTRNSAVPPYAITSVAANAVVPTTTDIYVDRRRLMDAGEHVLIAIYTRTGSVSTYPVFPPDLAGRYDGRPVNVSGGDAGVSGPFKYALQATNTGL